MNHQSFPRFRPAALVFLFLVVATFASAQSIRDLNVLIGKWSVEEKHASGWEEKGIRTCEWIMDSTYMQCETRTESPAGNGRTYRFLINYNKLSKHFEMMGIYSNWPLKQHDAISMDGNGTVWTLTEIPLEDKSTERRATITFNDRDNYVWSGVNVNRSKNTTTRYVETGKRITE